MYVVMKLLYKAGIFLALVILTFSTNRLIVTRKTKQAMRVVSCIALFVVAAMANSDRPQYKLENAPALFEKFIKDFNKQYKDEEDKAAHYKAFVKSLETINKANEEQSSATFDINHLADYTPDERKHLFGLRLPEKKKE